MEHRADTLIAQMRSDGLRITRARRATAETIVTRPRTVTGCSPDDMFSDLCASGRRRPSVAYRPSAVEHRPEVRMNRRKVAVGRSIFLDCGHRPERNPPDLQMIDHTYGPLVDSQLVAPDRP